MGRLNTGLSMRDWALMFALGIPPVVIVMIITWVYLAPDEPLVDPNATPTPIETPAPTFTPEEGAFIVEIRDPMTRSTEASLIVLLSS